MSSSGFLSHSNCGPTFHTTLLLLSFCLCLYFRLFVSVSVQYLSLSRCALVCFPVFIARFPSHYTVGEQAFFFVVFFYEWDVLLTELFLSALMMNTYSVTTNFLLYHSASSDWLRLASQWQRLCVFEAVVNVCFLWVYLYMCVCMWDRVLRGLSGLLFREK